MLCWFLPYNITNQYNCIHIYVCIPSLRRRQWHPTPVLLPGKSMDGGARWAAIHGVTKSQTRLHFHFSLSCIGEGNGNPLHCSCLENPRDGGAWWAAVYGVTQSRTRLKQLSSSSSSIPSLLSLPPTLPPSHCSRSSQNTRLGSLTYTELSTSYLLYN